MSYNINHFKIPFNVKEKHIDILLDDSTNSLNKSATIYT